MSYLTLPFVPAFNASGLIAGSSKLKFYLTETTTPANVYADPDLSTSLGSTVTADAFGRFVAIYLDPDVTYRVRLETSLGALIQEADGINYGGASTNVLAEDGTVSAPSIAFASEPTGFYRPGATTISLAINGTRLASWNAVGQTIGGDPSSAAKMTIYTQTSEVKNAFEIYHSADQTFAANQTLPFVIHNYTDAVSATIDTVGTNVSLRLKQARNAAARPDKPSTFIGTGRFIEFLRARVTGSGNTGDGVDILASFDAQGLLRFYGSNGADWDGTDTTAPVQFGSYTGFFTESGYMGWDYANSQFIIGSIESGVAFLPIQLACSAIKVLGDGTVNLATSSNRLGTVHTINVKTSPVAVSALPAAGTIGSGARAFVNDSNVAASGNFGAVVAGGGSANVPVYSDGSNWRIG